MSNIVEHKTIFNNPAEFKERVQKAGGRILVLVHTFYVRGDQRFQTALRKAMKTERVPVVVFDSPSRFGEGDWGKLNPFYVPGYPADPRPLDGGWASLHKALKGAGVSRIWVGGAEANDLSTYVLEPENEHDLDRLDDRIAVVEQYIRKLQGRSEAYRRPGRIISLGCAGRTFSELVRANYAKVELLPDLLFPHRPHEAFKERRR